jgi:hypothetical protein
VEAPGVARYRVNLAALLIDLARFDEARAQVEALRSLGRMHQYDGLADQLQLRLLQREGRAVDGAVVRPAEQRTH